MPDVIAFIPARYESTRFPGKLLAADTGQPLIQHVWERARAATCVDRVLIATDDDRIRATAEGFGAEVVMTRRDHRNGTSRIAEAASGLDVELIVNVQGDEPEIEPTLIDEAIATIRMAPSCVVGTLATPLAETDDANDPNLVKVVVDADDRALYFSRAPIPAGGPWLRHLGLYVYRPAFLATYAGLSPTPLEGRERLEQLRILEHGFGIAVGKVSGCSHRAGIDTAEQYRAFVERWRGK